MGSLAEDLLGFALEGFQNIGQKAKASNEQSARIADAVVNHQPINEDDLKGAMSDITSFIPFGSTQFSKIAQVAKEGVVPITPIGKMWPALIDERTKNIIHASQPIHTGWHDVAASQAPKGFKGTRGFVDPVSWNAFTEKVLEGLSKAGFRL